MSKKDRDLLLDAIIHSLDPHNVGGIKFDHKPDGLGYPGITARTNTPGEIKLGPGSAMDELVKQIEYPKSWQGGQDSVTRDTPEKYDQGKPQWSLFPFKSAEDVVRVLEFGIEKYKVKNSWMDVKDGERRYIDAIGRHYAAICSGETYDPESGMPHMAHLACSALFVLHFMKETMDAK